MIADAKIVRITTPSCGGGHAQIRAWDAGSRFPADALLVGYAKKTGKVWRARLYVREGMPTPGDDWADLPTLRALAAHLEERIKRDGEWWQ